MASKSRACNEIIRLQTVTKVPRAPRLRRRCHQPARKVIPVVDLRRRFGLPTADHTRASRIVVVELGDQVVGIVVDGVSEVSARQHLDVEPPSPVVAVHRLGSTCTALPNCRSTGHSARPATVSSARDERRALDVRLIARMPRRASAASFLHPPDGTVSETRARPTSSRALTRRYQSGGRSAPRRAPGRRTRPRCLLMPRERNLAAVYLAPELGPQAKARMALEWPAPARVDEQVVAALPAAFGAGSGILVPLFQAGREVRELDLLDGAPADEPPPPHLPVRSIIGFPCPPPRWPRHRSLLVGSRQPNAFDEPAVDARCALLRSGVGIDNARLAGRTASERRMLPNPRFTLGTVLESVGSGVCVVDAEGICA